MFAASAKGSSTRSATPRVRVVLSLVTVVSTVGFNFHVILPLLASDTLDTGPEVFGLLSAAFGVGALAGALLAATLGRASWKLFLVGMAAFSARCCALAPVQTSGLAGSCSSSRGRVHALDVERERDPAAERARRAARPDRQPLPLRLRRLRAARRPARRLARRRRRHGAELRGGRRDRPRGAPLAVRAAGSRRRDERFYTLQHGKHAGLTNAAKMGAMTSETRRSGPSRRCSRSTSSSSARSSRAPRSRRGSAHTSSGPKMVRAEVILKEAEACATTASTAERSAPARVGSLTLRERDGTVVTLPVAPTPP